MADIEQGIKYEITADATQAETEMKKVKSSGEANFNAVKAASAALHGNFIELGRELGKMIPAFRKMGEAATVALSAAGAAVMSLVKLGKELHKLFRTVFRLDTLKGDLKTASDLIFDLGRKASAFRDGMAEARERSKAMTSDFERQAKAISAMTKAQIEYNRQLALAQATTDDDRDGINLKFDREAADADAALRMKLAKRTLGDLKAERKRIGEELVNSERIQRDLERTERERSRRGIALSGSDADKAQANLSLAARAKTERYAEMERSDELKRTLAEIESKIAEARKAVETARIEAETASLSRGNEDAERSRKQQEDLIRQEEEWIREQDEWMAKAAEESAAEVERAQAEAEERIHRMKLANIESEKNAVMAAQEDEQAALSRLAAAQSAVSQAWGWYRNKDSLRAQLAEEKANAEAEKAYEKDYRSLTRKTGWRTAKNLSVDEEATRRVALAREEENAARRAVIETQANTARAADALEDLLAAVENGGEE